MSCLACIPQCVGDFESAHWCSHTRPGRGSSSFSPWPVKHYSYSLLVRLVAALVLFDRACAVSFL